jgi:hypothetical protein
VIGPCPHDDPGCALCDPLTIQHLPGTEDGTVDRELVALVDAAQGARLTWIAIGNRRNHLSAALAQHSAAMSDLSAALAPYSEGVDDGIV